MKRDTVADEIAELEKPVNDDRAKRLAILRELPPDMESPSIANIRDKGDGLEGQVAAWLSFLGPSYDPDHIYNPVAVLQTLHQHGWATCPATLVQHDDYRPSPHLGEVADIPDKEGRYTVTDLWPIVPLWVKPEQHGQPEAICYLKAPGGRVFRVAVKLPPVTAPWADRVEYKGGWNFRRGTGRLRRPENWHHIEYQGQVVAQLERHTGAQVDTEQGVSGQIYWEPVAHEQDEFPMTAADILAELLAGTK